MQTYEEIYSKDYMRLMYRSGNLSYNIAAKMIESEENWNAISKFCEQSLKIKNRDLYNPFRHRNE